MIEPTVGRVVWFYRYVAGQGHKGPLAAHVAAVNRNGTVNLLVIGSLGNPFSEQSVLLVQEDADETPLQDYCTWMPYQKQQACKASCQTEKTAQTVRKHVDDYLGR